jgi:hypothetical protein
VADEAAEVSIFDGGFLEELVLREFGDRVRVKLGHCCDWVKYTWSLPSIEFWFWYWLDLKRFLLGQGKYALHMNFRKTPFTRFIAMIRHKGFNNIGALTIPSYFGFRELEKR